MNTNSFVVSFNANKDSGEDTRYFTFAVDLSGLSCSHGLHLVAKKKQEEERNLICPRIEKQMKLLFLLSAPYLIKKNMQFQKQ